MSGRPALYGLLAEFATAEELTAAAQAAYAEGYRCLEAYSPYPVPELAAALHLRRPVVPLLVFFGGLLGCVGGFYLQYYLTAHSYPLNVGGRPLNSWPAFVPITFELTVLVAALTAMLGMFAGNGLPQLDHPVFNVDRFALATRDRFFLCIESIDRRFAPATTRSFLLRQKASEVTDVETRYPHQDP